MSRRRKPLVDRQPDEPAKQQIELQPFDQLPLRADRIEKLQQRGPQQPLRRNGRTAAPLVKRRKRSVEIRQRRVGQPSHRPQRMLRRDPRLDVDVGEQRPARPILASHRSLAIRFANPRNHTKRRNTSNFSGDFFSTLLERLASAEAVSGTGVFTTGDMATSLGPLGSEKGARSSLSPVVASAGLCQPKAPFVAAVKSALTPIYAQQRAHSKIA